MGTEQKNLDVPLKVTGEATFGNRYPIARDALRCGQGVSGLAGGCEKLDFSAIKHMPGVHSVVPLPAGPQMYSGGVAVVADSWWRARTALDAMPINGITVVT